MTEPKPASLTDATLASIVAVNEPISYKPFTPSEVEARRQILRAVIGFVVLVAIAGGIFALRHGAFGSSRSSSVYDQRGW